MIYLFKLSGINRHAKFFTSKNIISYLLVDEEFTDSNHTLDYSLFIWTTVDY